ncbi:retrovirus-related pol polyprotein from transposon TNT 1-94 [Tanacetum coccineum]
MSKYYEGDGIFHQKSVPRTPQQNGVVKRRNRTLVEVARTMLIFSKAPMFLWAEAIATVCYTQNRSLIHTRHKKTPYELVHDKKHDLIFFRVFGALCYPTNDSEDLGKFQAKADIGIFVGYAPSRKGYRIYKKRTRRLMEIIHVTFDEMHPTMAPVRMKRTSDAQNTTSSTSHSEVPHEERLTPLCCPPNEVYLCDTINSSLPSIVRQRLTRKSFSKDPRVHSKELFQTREEVCKGVGRTREIVDEEKEIDENILSTEDVLSTDKEKYESKLKSMWGKERLFLHASSQAISSRKGERLEWKDIEETDRVDLLQAHLTLKPLPKIDPKDKGKKKIEEEDESESESDGIPEAEKKFKQLESILLRSSRTRREQFIIEERGKSSFMYKLLLKDIHCTEDQRMNEKGIDFYKVQMVMEESKGCGQEKSKRKESRESESLMRLNAVYLMVMDRYKDEIPEVLVKYFGRLMVMLQHCVENEFWNSQTDWNIVKLEANSSSGGTHFSDEEGLVIHML